MKNLRRFVILLSISFLSSCITYRYIDVQVLNPGSVKLPSNITLHIIEPQITGRDYAISPKDSLMYRQFLNKLLLHNLDSTVKSHLQKSPLFNNSNICLQNAAVFRMEIAQMSSDEKNDHILMTVQQFNITEQKPYLHLSLYDTEFQYIYDYIAANEVLYKFKIELSNLGTGVIYGSFDFSDTLKCISKSSLISDAFKNLPSASEEMIEIGKRVGEQYAQKISPYWTSEERMLCFSNNQLMRKGYKLFVANDLLGAVNTWKHLYQVGTSKLASIAAFNIALVYEMLDDFENSELWLNNSIKAKSTSQAQTYLKLIKERNENRKKIDEQLKNT